MLWDAPRLNIHAELMSETAVSPGSVPLGLWLTLQMLMLVFAFQPLFV